MIAHKSKRKSCLPGPPQLTALAACILSTKPECPTMMHQMIPDSIPYTLPTMLYSTPMATTYPLKIYSTCCATCQRMHSILEYPTTRRSSKPTRRPTLPTIDINSVPVAARTTYLIQCTLRQHVVDSPMDSPIPCPLRRIPTRSRTSTLPSIRRVPPPHPTPLASAWPLKSYPVRCTTQKFRVSMISSFCTTWKGHSPTLAVCNTK
jgi:hypothetical protein